MNRHDVAIAVRLAASASRTVTETAALRACADGCDTDREYLRGLIDDLGTVICAGCGRASDELPAHDPLEALADLCDECYREHGETMRDEQAWDRAAEIGAVL